MLPAEAGQHQNYGFSHPYGGEKEDFTVPPMPAIGGKAVGRFFVFFAPVWGRKRRLYRPADGAVAGKPGGSFLPPYGGEKDHHQDMFHTPPTQLLFAGRS